MSCLGIKGGVPKLVRLDMRATRLRRTTNNLMHSSQKRSSILLSNHQRAIPWRRPTNLTHSKLNHHSNHMCSSSTHPSNLIVNRYLTRCHRRDSWAPHESDSLLYPLPYIFIPQRLTPDIYHLTKTWVSQACSPWIDFVRKNLKVVLYNDMQDETGSSSLSETAGELFSKMKFCDAQRPRLREYTRA
jgi:hypothetical protein